MFSLRHHKGLLLLVTPPPPPLSSRGVVFTVACDGIAKEQRGVTSSSDFRTFLRLFMFTT